MIEKQPFPVNTPLGPGYVVYIKKKDPDHTTARGNVTQAQNYIENNDDTFLAYWNTYLKNSKLFHP